MAVFNEIVESSTEGIRRDSNLMNNGSCFLKKLLGIRESGFEVLDLNNGPKFGRRMLRDQSYPDQEPIEKLVGERYFTVWEDGFNKNRGLKTLMDICALDANYSMDCDSYLERRHRKGWDECSTMLMAFDFPHRSSIARKVALIKTQIENLIEIRTEVQDSGDIWIYKLLEKHRILSMNFKLGLINSCLRLNMKLQRASLPKEKFAVPGTCKADVPEIFNATDYLILSDEIDITLDREFYNTYFTGKIEELIFNCKVEGGDPNPTFGELADYLNCEISESTEKRTVIERILDVKGILQKAMKKHTANIGETDPKAMLSFEKFINQSCKEVAGKDLNV